MATLSGSFRLFKSSMFLKSLWFQAVWFVAVLGRQEYLLVLLLMIVGTYIYSIYKNELSISFVGALVGCGLVIDTGNIFANVLSFENDGFPIWLVGLWLIFAWYCWQIRAILIRLPLFSVLFIGGLGGALSYFAGCKLDAVVLPLSVYTTFLLLFLEWILLSLSVRLLIHNRWKLQ